MLTMFDAPIAPPPAPPPPPPTRMPQSLEQKHMLDRAAALTVRIQKLRELAAALTVERDELQARIDALAK
jgi:hypothetical protein